MSQDQEIFEAARAIRPYLPDLVGERAEATDHELAALLADVESQGTDERILVLLEAERATREWAAAFFTNRCPPDIAEITERAFGELPGHGEPVAATKFECPQGDYVWYRRAVGQAVPACPTHDVTLKPAKGS